MFPGMVSDECLICGAAYYGGGLLIRGSFLCGSCESKLVGSGCDDIMYGYYVNGLKKIWRCPVA